VVFSVAEVAMLPALEIIIFRIAPAASNGSYFGVFNVVFGLGTALGSFMGGYTFNLGKNGFMALHDRRDRWRLYYCDAVQYISCQTLTFDRRAGTSYIKRTLSRGTKQQAP